VEHLSHLNHLIDKRPAITRADRFYVSCDNQMVFQLGAGIECVFQKVSKIPFAFLAPSFHNVRRIDIAARII
jgi:hypothetical protein